MFHFLDINEHLGSNEKIVLFFRPSRKAYILQYLSWFFILFMSIFLLVFAKTKANTNLFIFWKFIELAAYLFMFITAIMLIRLEYRIFSRRYALTSERALYSRGIFYEQFKSMTYSCVTDIQFMQSFWDKIMDTGTLMINSAGADTYEIRYRKVSDPLGIKKRINDFQVKHSKTRNVPQVHIKKEK